MSSPSTKHYKPVQHEDGLNDEESESHQEDPHEDTADDDDDDDDSDDLRHIRVEGSDDDSDDDRTEPTSNIHQNPFSFDLDEEEDELQRYRLRTTSSSGARQTTSAVLSKKITFTTLWEAYQEARVENRRRRAERLLSMNDSPRERLLLCTMSWCDLTDRGWLLYGLLVLIWIALCHSSQHRAALVLAGICFFVLRLAWRPVYWCIWGRRLEQKRQETMAIYDELNGVGDWHGNEQQQPEEPDVSMLVV